MSQAPSCARMAAPDSRPRRSRSASMRSRALEAYAVMPGGLARVATEGAPRRRVQPAWRRQQGHLGAAAGRIAGRNRASAGHGAGRAAAPMRHDDVPSRLVENLYWFGRYTARCEDKARLLRATLAARIDADVYAAAVRFCRELGAAAADADPTVALRDDVTPHGIIADARHLTWCASQIRSRLSASYWRTIAELQRQLHGWCRRARRSAQGTRAACCCRWPPSPGLALDDMRQDDGWRLLSIGRRIERLQFCDATAGASSGGRDGHAAGARGVAAGGLRQPARVPPALCGRAAARADARSADSRSPSIRARSRSSGTLSRTTWRCSPPHAAPSRRSGCPSRCRA